MYDYIIAAGEKLTSVFAIQPIFDEVVQLQDESAGSRKQWQVARHVFQICPYDAIATRWLRGRSAPDYKITGSEF